MDLNILLWIGGTLFSLGIFAVKVGLGLRFGQAKLAWTAATLSLYVACFVVVASLSRTLVGFIEPVLRKGPYLHMFMALGLIIWGVFVIKGLRGHSSCAPERDGVPTVSSFLLIVPCPVCITAMIFSTWTALTVIKAHPALVGLGLGVAFVLMTLLVMAFAAASRVEHPETTLGLTMVTIGLYYIASLFLPAKIAEAKGMYASLAVSNHDINAYHTLGVAAILLAAVIVGFLAGKHLEVNK